MIDVEVILGEVGVQEEEVDVDLLGPFVLQI